jgi:cyanophycinase
VEGRGRVAPTVCAHPFLSDTDAEIEVVTAAGASEVVVLPTGAAYEHPQRFVDAAAERYAAAGLAARGLDVLRRPDAVDEANAAVVRSAAAIYLAGPSSMHLVSVLKHTPVWDALVEAWRGGAALLASGAGAMAMCDPMVDPRGGAFTVGLGLLSGVTVIPRFDTWSEDTVHRTRTLSPSEVVIVGVASGSALVRDADGTWRGSGPTDPRVFVGGEPGELTDIPH